MHLYKNANTFWQAPQGARGGGAIEIENYFILYQVWHIIGKKRKGVFIIVWPFSGRPSLAYDTLLLSHIYVQTLYVSNFHGGMTRVRTHTAAED